MNKIIDKSMLQLRSQETLEKTILKMSDVARRADDMSVFKLKKNHLAKYNPHYNASLTLNATLS